MYVHLFAPWSYLSAQKLDRRLQIASVMANLAHTLGNVEQYTCWAHILDSLNRLGVVGMSDDEEALDTQGQQGIIVYEPAFRNPGFNRVYDRVDSTREIEKSIFTAVGRKQLPRIRGYDRVERSPPANLPRSYYHPDYLNAMEKGVVANVAIAIDEETAIPRYESLCK
ncbi:hypothetical protein EV368DRAFT_53276 [Lentinula lateritia]|nr:hypothetical protein EV368DRAFT_53276 [Lentinula lateritia]